ncbi:DIP1984 family protein [Deinococcus aluminii]|uniref:Septicolysin n=1 Tax=Deinococcus aluminii TaxID=1656885 RepID=A0ABP9XAQ8_9DEIO
MKLAEALIDRADLQKRAAQLEARILANMQVQEGDLPAEAPLLLLNEFLTVTAALESLLPRIHRANLTTTLEGGDLTLTEALTRRDMLDLRLRVLRGMAEAATLKQTRYSNSEVKLVAVVPARDLQKQVDALAQERRELDTRIQQTNWLTDLP